jgi:hypothetical protein
MDTMSVAHSYDEYCSPSQCFSSDNASPFARQLLAGTLDFQETDHLSHISNNNNNNNNAGASSPYPHHGAYHASSTTTSASNTAAFPSNSPVFDHSERMYSSQFTPVTALDHVELQQMARHPSSATTMLTNGSPARPRGIKRKQCDMDMIFTRDPARQSSTSSPCYSSDLPSSVSLPTAASLSPSSSLPVNEPNKHRKVQHTAPTIRELTTRSVFVSFGSHDPMPAKIVFKEPWGVMVEILGYNAELDVIPNSRYWATWTGSVNLESVPILDIMYKC